MATANEEMDNETLQRLLKSGGVTNTVQPGMEESQGTAPSQPAPTSMSGSDMTDSRDNISNVAAPRPASGNTGVTGGTAVIGQAQDGGSNSGITKDAFSTTSKDTTASTVDSSKWDTDGYGAPKYTAQNYGNAVAGFDQTKWADPNHQTPKYVVGRILQEASGGTGNLADPTQRAAAIAKIQEAYPGATYDGKDKIVMPDGGTVDIFTGASAGQYGIAWQPETGPGGQPLPNEASAGAGGGNPFGSGGGSSTDRINSLVPTDTSTYQRLLAQLQGIIGPQAQDREALMNLMSQQG